MGPTRRARRRSGQMVCRSLGWLGVMLLLTACSTTPGRPSASATATTPVLAVVSAYHGHTSLVYAVAWSPDGTRIASASNDSTVQVWEVRTGHLLVKYLGHVEPVYTVAWSPDGSLI